MNEPALTALLQREDIWRGHSARHAPACVTAIATGFPKLDQALQCRGWPSAALTELLTPQPDVLGLRLLLPALSTLPDGMLIFANPPMTPSARYLNALGIDLQRVLTLRSQCSQTLLRSCSEAAASGSVTMLLFWAHSQISWQGLHRLQLAARQGNCCLMLLADARKAQQHSPAALRLSVRPQPAGQIIIEILKQPGGWGGQHLTVLLYPELTARPPQTKHLPIPQAMQTRPVLLSRKISQTAPMAATPIQTTWQHAGSTQDALWSPERQLVTAMAHLPPTTDETNRDPQKGVNTPHESASADNTLETH